MKSALEIVAFAHRSRLEGIVALLQTAQEAMSDEGLAEAALLIDHALYSLHQAHGDFAHGQRPHSSSWRALN